MLSVKGKKTNALNDLNEIEFVLNYLYLKRGFMFCVYYEVIKYGRRVIKSNKPGMAFFKEFIL